MYQGFFSLTTEPGFQLLRAPVFLVTVLHTQQVRDEIVMGLKAH